MIIKVQILDILQIVKWSEKYLLIAAIQTRQKDPNKLRNFWSEKYRQSLVKTMNIWQN